MREWVSTSPTVAEVKKRFREWAEALGLDGFIHSSNGFARRGDVASKVDACKTLEDIDAAIGNNSWTSIQCGRCERKVPVTITWDDEEYSHDFCQACFKEMLAKLEEATR